MEKKSEGKTRKCLTLLGGRTSLLLCLSLMFQSSYAAEDSTVPKMGNMEIHQIAQQSSTIKGVVKDQKGEPLIGVSIVVKGTTNGTASDFDGNFTLDVPDNSTLVFSFIGFKSQEVRYTGQKTLNIVLAEDSETLDEVVVVGYGSQKKGEITSSVTSVKASDFNKAPVVNPMQLVEGRVAGLTVSRGSTDPNGEVKVQMRGASSLKGSNEPLVIIDGMPGNMTSLNAIAPEDIEAIDVLKDGSAAAIYGTRGNNGVIIVSTRRPQAGTTQVDYSGYIMHEAVYKRPEILNGDEFVAYGKETNNANIRDFGGRDNHYDALLNKSNFTHVHNLTATGGNGKTNYRASLNYKKNDGMIRNTSRETINGSIAVNHRAFDDKLQLSFNLANSFVKVDAVSDDVDKVGDIPNYGILYQAIRINPTMPIYKEDGSFWETYSGYEDFNPVARIYQRTKKKEFKNLLANFKAQYEIIPGLTAAAFFAMEKNDALTNDYSMREEYSQYKDGTNGRAKKEYYQNTNRTTEWTANYNTSINGVHNITGLLGYSYQDFEYEQFSAENKNFLTDVFGTNNLEAGGYLKDGKAEMKSKKETSKLIAFFARANYNYDGKYMASASIRREGSTKFGANNKWAWFPSVSAGWMISREDFMESQEVFDVLKFRAGFGITGSLPTDPYMSLATYGTGAGAWNAYTGSWLTATYGPNINPNPDLKWEKTGQFDVGFEIGFWQNRLSFDVAYYNKKTTDLLLDCPIPHTTGFTTVYKNIGSVRNQGMDLMISARPVQTQDFNWSSTINLNFNKNKILQLGDNNEDIEMNSWVGGSESILRVGENMSSFYGYRRLGVYTEEDFNNGLCEKNQIGRAKRTDKKEIIGKGMPDWTGSWINNFSYKNFDLTMDLQFVWGVETMQQFYHSTYDRFGITNGLSNILYDAYNGSNPNTMQQAVYLCNSGHAGQDTTVDSQWIANGSYLRCNMLQLGYTFDSNVISKIGLSALRLYASANNLFLITASDFTGYDPEGTSQGDSNKFGQNMVFFSYPRARTFTFGVNVTF